MLAAFAHDERQLSSLCSTLVRLGALEHIDDSDGMMRGVIERLEDLHLRACRRGTPDPVALAERLLSRELGGDWDVFDRAAIRYAEVLGGPGLARYRELAEARWASVPKPKAGDDTHDRYGARFLITRVMEALGSVANHRSGEAAARSSYASCCGERS